MWIGFDSMRWHSQPGKNGGPNWERAIFMFCSAYGNIEAIEAVKWNARESKGTKSHEGMERFLRRMRSTMSRLIERAVRDHDVRCNPRPEEYRAHHSSRVGTSCEFAGALMLLHHFHDVMRQRLHDFATCKLMQETRSVRGWRALNDPNDGLDHRVRIVRLEYFGIG